MFIESSYSSQTLILGPRIPRYWSNLVAATGPTAMQTSPIWDGRMAVTQWWVWVQAPINSLVFALYLWRWQKFRTFWSGRWTPSRKKHGLVPIINWLIGLCVVIKPTSWKPAAGNLVLGPCNLPDGTRTKSAPNASLFHHYSWLGWLFIESQNQALYHRCGDPHTLDRFLPFTEFLSIDTLKIENKDNVRNARIVANESTRLRKHLRAALRFKQYRL